MRSREGLTEVPQEAIACGRAAYYASREHRQVGPRVVATTLAELREDVVGPIRDTRLVAVREHVLQALLADQLRAQGLLILGEVGVEVGFDVVLVEFVDLESGAFARSRMVGAARQRIAEAQDDPPPPRRRPVERSVRSHAARQVEDGILGDGFLRIDGRRVVSVGDGTVGETRLVLETIHARRRHAERLQKRCGRSAAVPAGRPKSDPVHWVGDRVARGPGERNAP